MDDVLLDQFLGGFDARTANGGGGCRSFAMRPPNPRKIYNSSPFPSTPNMISHGFSSGIWIFPASTPTLPYARPPIYSSRSLPLLPFNQTPLLPLPPPTRSTSLYPCPRPPNKAKATRKNPRTPRREPPQVEKKKKPLERATPLPAAPVVAEALDDLDIEVARSYLEEMLHAISPPPSSLPLPKFSLLKSSATATAVSCNAEVAGRNGGTAEASTATDVLRSLLRL